MATLVTKDNRGKLARFFFVMKVTKKNSYLEVKQKMRDKIGKGAKQTNVGGICMGNMLYLLDFAISCFGKQRCNTNLLHPSISDLAFFQKKRVRNLSFLENYLQGSFLDRFNFFQFIPRYGRVPNWTGFLCDKVCC